jgi:DNA repair exonuclease SbcCD nuclease subunit
MRESGYAGILAIGDPHLEGRVPGFRKDDYPTVILRKLQWCLDYATTHSLLPAVLGDLFHMPRDNPTWMLAELIDMLDREVVGIYGNHDTADPILNEHDSLTLLARAGRLTLLTPEAPWRGVMNGRQVVVGGSSYRVPIPASFEVEAAGGQPPFVVWLAHHDIAVPGYDGGRIVPKERPGIDVVVNGHIHRRLEPVTTGATQWFTPGNISRRSRTEAAESHVPAVLRIDVTAHGWACEQPIAPYAAFDEVFHDAIVDSATDASEQSSSFVAGLGDLLARRTETGAGLMEFIRGNVEGFTEDVAREILTLAEEVADGGQQ